MSRPYLLINMGVYGFASNNRVGAAAAGVAR
jgi:hypothetical protein